MIQKGGGATLFIVTHCLSAFGAKQPLSAFFCLKLLLLLRALISRFLNCDGIRPKFVTDDKLSFVKKRDVLFFATRILQPFSKSGFSPCSGNN